MKKNILLIILFCVSSSSYAEISWEKCADSIEYVDSFLAYGDYVFIGTRSNGIIVSSNNGNSWSVRNNGLSGNYVLDLENIDSLIFSICIPGGFFKTTDYGLTWYQQEIKVNGIGSIAEFNKQLVGAGSNIYKSIDSGKTWIEILGKRKDNYYSDIAFENSTIAAGGNRLAISTDNGKSWISWEDLSLGDSLYGINNIKCLGIYNNCLFISSDWYGIYCTCDNGKTWEIQDQKSSHRNVWQYKKYRNIFFECSDPNLNVRVVKNGQETWKRFSKGEPRIYIKKIAFNNNYIFVYMIDELANIHSIYRHPIGILDEPDVNISGSINVCVADTVSYSSKYQKYLTTKWRVEGGTLDSTSTDSLIKVIWQNPGSGRVIITKYNDLIELSDSTILEINIFEYPAKPNIRYIKDTLWSDSPEGNQWFKNGKDLEGENKNYFFTSDSGSYSVQVTLNGCASEMSDTINLDALGVEDIQGTDVFSVSPNPATDYIEISVPRWRGIKGVDYGVKIYNVFGEEIPPRLTASGTPQEGNLGSSSSQYSLLNTQYYKLDVSGLPPGIYFVRVGEKVAKFLKV